MTWTRLLSKSFKELRADIARSYFALFCIMPRRD